MKKVAILVNEFDPAQGGVGNQAYYLAKYLCGVCDNVSVLTFYQTESDFAFDEKQPFKIYRRKKYNRNLFHTIVLLNYVLRTLKEERTDTIIISNYFYLWLLPVIRLFYRKANYATIIHGSELRHTNLILRSLTYLGLAYSKQIIAVSEFTRNILKGSIFYKRTKVCHIGIPDELITSTGRSYCMQPIKLATIGAFTKKKGYINVLKILPEFINKYPDGAYKVCGVSNVLDFYNAVNKYSTIILLKSRIESSPSFTNTNLDHISAFFNDVGIYIALAEQTKRGDVEGYGIALLEANVCGIPVIATDNFGFRETVKNKFSGILVNPHNKTEIICAIDEIISNYPTYSANAREWAFEHRWSKLYKSYYEVISH